MHYLSLRKKQGGWGVEGWGNKEKNDTDLKYKKMFCNTVHEKLIVTYDYQTTVKDFSQILFIQFIRELRKNNNEGNM